MVETIAAYGPQVLAWVLAALGSLLATHVFLRIKEGYVRDVLQRAWIEVQGAVTEVSQVYADAIKRAREDGQLTQNEKAAAKTMAMDVAKANIGVKGLARLARVIGIPIDQWLASKTEQAVAQLKAAQPAPVPRQPA